MYIDCMLYLHFCIMIKLKMNLPKQTIRRLGCMSKMSLAFVNIGFLTKVLEVKKKQWKGPLPLHLSECNFSQFGDKVGDQAWFLHCNLRST